MHSWARVAEIIKTKAIEGGLVLVSSDGLPFLLEEGMAVNFVPPQIDCPRQAQVVSIQEIKKSTYLVFFDTVTNIQIAEGLVGCFCLVQREDLPEKIESLYQEENELHGFKVVDDSFGELGVVAEIIENRAQSLIQIQGEERSLLIPFVDEFVKKIDEEHAVISVSIPQSLYDLKIQGK